MSYILDALRKADAQRERDPARGIHAQPLQGSADAAPVSRLKRNAAIAGLAGLVSVAAVAWYLHRAVPKDAPREVVAAAQPSPAPVPPAAQVMPPPVNVPRTPVIASPSVVPVQAATPLAMQASRPEPAPLIMAPAATGQPPGMTPLHGPSGPGMQPVQPNAPLAPPNAAVTQPLNAAIPGQPARAAAPLPPSQPLPPVHGLPPDAPKLVINGGVYSANKAQRMLIVNGQVVAEGADLGSGVKLEQITQKSAVLSFRGARYTVGY